MRKVPKLQPNPSPTKPIALLTKKGTMKGTKNLTSLTESNKIQVLLMCMEAIGEPVS